MRVNIRQEREEDFQAVFNLIKKSFEAEVYSDHKEHYLVEKLRKSEAFIPELSLVAEFENQIVGYILLTKINIFDKKQSFEALALAPVVVLPDFQRKGIGGQLIETVHQKARSLAYKAIILLGHKDYYPRFGYSQVHKFGINLPFNVPKENCMAIELVEDALLHIQGLVQYPKEFME